MVAGMVFAGFGRCFGVVLGLGLLRLTGTDVSQPSLFVTDPPNSGSQAQSPIPTRWSSEVSQASAATRATGRSIRGKLSFAATRIGCEMGAFPPGAGQLTACCRCANPARIGCAFCTTAALPTAGDSLFAEKRCRSVQLSLARRSFEIKCF